MSFNGRKVHGVPLKRFKMIYYDYFVLSQLFILVDARSLNGCLFVNMTD